MGLMLKCQPSKISRGGCSHLASPGIEFQVKLSNGCHVGITNGLHMDILMIGLNSNSEFYKTSELRPHLLTYSLV